MVDVALILFTTLFGLLLLIASTYFMVYFAHPDDKWIAWFPKVVVVRFFSSFFFFPPA
ncbi:MAG: hypothetical protein BJ554DRAFT_5681 [Olpidium bornovanus]|uniref:Uncharacterized protein n=1 Tax=Olpidium bornovanus TaxID=278681 RepID=A0A8H8DKU7_9FUNG|nr:MAG: hypothetical protein BJ554DRAFT_5681 [Olpidium bornovanus]